MMDGVIDDVVATDDNSARRPRARRRFSFGRFSPRRRQVEFLLTNSAISMRLGGVMVGRGRWTRDSERDRSAFAQ